MFAVPPEGLRLNSVQMATATSAQVPNSAAPNCSQSPAPAPGTVGFSAKATAPPRISPAPSPPRKMNGFRTPGPLQWNADAFLGMAQGNCPPAEAGVTGGWLGRIDVVPRHSPRTDNHAGRCDRGRA